MPAGPVLFDVGAVFGVVGTVIVTLGLISKARPVRWVFRHLIGDPLTQWHRAQTLYVVEAAIAPVNEQLKQNGGTSLRDRVDDLTFRAGEIERLLRQQGIGDDIAP